MGGLEASDPLQFIPPPTLKLRMGDFLLVYVKILLRMFIPVNSVKKRGQKNEKTA